MKWLCIENDGVVPIEAIEMIGGTDKHSSKFIGMFGSGMKYAIAAAIRNDIDLRIVADDKVIKFDSIPVSLSRDDVWRVRMQIDNNRPKDRDWTATMGAADWRSKPDEGISVEWMIVREFISNAIDEGIGYSCHIENKITKELGKTKVYIKLTDDVKEVADNLTLYFLRHSNRKAIDFTASGAIFKRVGPKGRIYCKGVFIRELPESLLYDYDFTNLPLTESRSIDYWNLQNKIGELLSGLQPEGLARVLGLISEDTGQHYFESKLSDYNLSSFDKEHIQEAFEISGGGVVCPKSMPQGLHDTLDSCGHRMVVMPEGWLKKMSEAGVKDYVRVIGRDIIDGFRFVDDDEVNDTIPEDVRERILEAYNFACQWFKVEEKPHLRYFNYQGNANADFKGRAEAGKYVAINYEFTESRIDLLQTMLEEFAHYLSGAPDFSRNLVNFLTRSISVNIL